VLLVILGAALVGACGTHTRAAAPSAGELVIEWEPRREQAEMVVPEVQVEVRGVEGDAPIRRHIELRAPDELQSRLLLPPGVYDVRLSSAVLGSAVLHATAAGSLATQASAELHSPLLPPPQMVLVQPAATTRARVGLAAQPGELAAL
jgi:hypothetical protein